MGMELSSAEENYLKALFHLTLESREKETGTGKVAEYLQVSPSSVNAMLKRLKIKGLVRYERYGKLQLSASGQRMALDMIRSLRASKATVAEALVQEYRFTARAIEFGDFAEGIRAAIIDKDKNPHWKHALGSVPQEIVDHMRAPLGDMELNLTGEQS